jgi:hypothetical protein
MKKMEKLPLSLRCGYDSWIVLSKKEDRKEMRNIEIDFDQY